MSSQETPLQLYQRLKQEKAFAKTGGGSQNPSSISCQAVSNAAADTNSTELSKLRSKIQELEKELETKKTEMKELEKVLVEAGTEAQDLFIKNQALIAENQALKNHSPVKIESSVLKSAATSYSSPPKSSPPKNWHQLALECPVEQRYANFSIKEPNSDKIVKGWDPKRMCKFMFFGGCSRMECKGEHHENKIFMIGNTPTLYSPTFAAGENRTAIPYSTYEASLNNNSNQSAANSSIAAVDQSNPWTD
jgi:hypothetical protein